MTTDQHMRQLADRGTGGHWMHGARGDDHWIDSSIGLTVTSVCTIESLDQADDADFIAAAREWVPDAIRRLDAIRELIDPSKAVKGSIASKILKALDGEA